MSEWEPECFRPERFLDEDAPRRHPGAYVPFAAGARNCLAADFAFLELRLALASLVQHFSFETLPEHEYRLEPQLALAPADGLPLRVRPRAASRGSGR